VSDADGMPIAEFDPKSLVVLAEKYVQHLMVTRGISRESKKAMRMRLRRFVRFCEERGIVYPIDVTRAVLEQYQKYLFHHRQRDDRPLKRKTQNLYLTTVRTLFRWLQKNRHILYDPAAELELMKVDKNLPHHVLSASNVEDVLNAIDTTQPAGLRDRALLEVLYSAGIRRCEAVKLKVYDLDMEKGLVRVRDGKGHKERLVPIGERALSWIQKYLEEVRPFWLVGEDDGTLFLSNRGTPISLRMMTAIGRRRMEASGHYQTGDALHIFRHSAATLMLEGGADIRYIQEYLGHAQLTTTQIYTKVSIEKLKAVHEATHPAKPRRTKTTSAELAGDERESTAKPSSFVADDGHASAERDEPDA
jgi:integrase/recombinase XerD